jgi:hypothetical protein
LTEARLLPKLADAVIQFVSRLPEQPSLAPLLSALAARADLRAAKIKRGKSGSK